MRKLQFQDVNKTALFLLLILMLVFISVLSEIFILHENLYYDYFRDKLNYDQVTELLHLKSKWSFLSYILIPFIYFFKFLVLSLWIMTGIILFGYKTTFTRIVHATILAEFVFLIPSFLGLIWFGFVKTDFSLMDMQYFQPFSLLNLFDPESLDSWMIYPLTSINIFQIIYAFVLAVGIGNAIEKDYKTSLLVTIPIYLSGIFIWVVFVTFLTISYTV